MLSRALKAPPPCECGVVLEGNDFGSLMLRYVFEGRLEVVVVVE